MTVNRRCVDCGFKRDDVHAHPSPCRGGEIVFTCVPCRERDHEGYEEQQAQYAEWTRDAEDAVRRGLW